MASKIRIKMGNVEVDYEGDEDFLKGELLGLLDSALQLYKKSGLASQPSVGGSGQAAPPPGSGATIQGTTGTIAAKLGCSSGPDLILAAAARMTFALSKGSFTRQELLDEMKEATSYYKSSHGKNLTQNLASLVKGGKLIESAKDTYALSAAEKGELETKLAT